MVTVGNVACSSIIAAEPHPRSGSPSMSAAGRATGTQPQLTCRQALILLLSPCPRRRFPENDIGDRPVVGDESLERARITMPASMTRRFPLGWHAGQPSPDHPNQRRRGRRSAGFVRQIGQGHVVDRRDGQRRFDGTWLGRKYPARSRRVQRAIEGPVRGRPLIPPRTR